MLELECGGRAQRAAVRLGSRSAAGAGGATRLKTPKAASFLINAMQLDGWRGMGWEVATCRGFVNDGRSWAAVERFYRGLTAGEHNLACLGLQLVEVPEGAAAAVGGPSQSVQPSGGTSVGLVTGAARCEAEEAPEPPPAEAAAPAARQGHRRTRRERLTYKVAVSYFGPAFQVRYGRAGNAWGLLAPRLHSWPYFVATGACALPTLADTLHVCL